MFGRISFEEPYQSTGLNTNYRFMAQLSPVMSCPSDVARPFEYDVLEMIGESSENAFVAPRGNYVASFGASTWDPANESDRGAFGRGRSLRTTDATGGLSQLVFVSETIQGVSIDSRGAVLTPLPGGCFYTADSGPQLASSGPPDRLAFPRNCDERSDIPCEVVADWASASAAARSRHPGGVNSLFGDGSVRTIEYGIDRDVWRRLHRALR